MPALTGVGKINKFTEMMSYVELSDNEIATIREGLRTSNDKNLIPLGQNLTDLDIEKLVYIVRNDQS